MKIRRIIASILCASALFAFMTGCDVSPADTFGSAGDTVTEPIPDISPADTEGDALKPTDPGYVIPDEELSGMNTSDSPLSDDGDSEAILSRLIKNELIKGSGMTTDTVLTRIAFAYDVVYMTGFLAQQTVYINTNEYTDLEKYSLEARRAEIAVNQGYMLRPAGSEFKPDEPVSYGEVLRGLLYALGYREYADKYGVAKLAAEVGLSNYIELSKKNSSTLTYKEYAQLVSNAMRMNVVQCISKDGELYAVSRGDGFDLKTAYIDKKSPESSAIFRNANEGWDIYPGGGYRYGPSMIINEDGSIDCWLASNSGVPGEVDWGKYRRSYDNGFTWTADTGSVRPTSSSEDWNWSCDPGVIKFGDYYYAAYTTILWHDGLDNNLFVARSKTPQGAFVEKWTGSGWGYGDPKAIVTFDGAKQSWGCGEGSMVKVGDTLYLYVSWNDSTGDATRVYTADATSENWPETLVFRGTAYKHGASEDSADVKYVDAYSCFISVATAQRFTDNCYVHVMTSFDGIYFREEACLRHTTEESFIQTQIHNMGITGDAEGHIDIFNTQQYIGYAYQPPGFKWANWKTRLSPIVFVGTDNYSNTENVISRSPDDTELLDTAHSPVYVQFRIGAKSGSDISGRDIKAKALDTEYKFGVVSMNRNGKEKSASASFISNIEYFYDKSKVAVDAENCTVKLLVPEVVRIYAKYEDLMCEFAVVPDFADRSAPVEFYPETETVTFYYRSEIKQPAFIAKSAANEYLMLWRGCSSYTEPNTKDTATELRKWPQQCEYTGYDESIVKIDEKGQMTAVGVGETTVTATYMGMTATMKIVVEKLR